MFAEVTSDYQEVTVQRQVIYRVADPLRTAALLNFALDAKGRYVSEDPQKLSQRVIDQVQVARNASVEQERAIKKNELNTEIAVENKRRQIKEAQMDADRAVRERRRVIEQEEMTGKISIDERKRQLVELATANTRQEADANAYGIDVMMKAFASSDAKVLQALASIGMQPGQLLYRFHSGLNRRS
jgi:hypothetical protein